MVVKILVGILASSFQLFAAMAPYLLFGFLFAGILHVFLSAEKIARHLGSDSFSSVVKAALFGIPLPLCSCGVIPPTMTLRKAGASRGAVLSFLIATPTTGVDSILATYSLLGPVFAVYRVFASFAAAIFAGVAANLLVPSKKEPSADNQTTIQNLGSNRPDWKEEVLRVLHFSFIELLSEIGKWLVIGTLIGGIITYAIPDAFFSSYRGSGWQAILLMLVIGVPLYVCATGSIPIAAALMMKGMNPGAAFAFLLVGPATNAISLTVINQYLGKKTTIVYLASLVAASVGFGILLDGLWLRLGLSQNMHHHIDHQIFSPWIEWTTVTTLSLLLISIFIKGRLNYFSKLKHPIRKDSPMKSTFVVPEMHCNHCIMTISNALKKVKGVEKVDANLSSKEVSVSHGDNVTRGQMTKAIEEVGYSIS